MYIYILRENMYICMYIYIVPNTTCTSVPKFSCKECSIAVMIASLWLHQYLCTLWLLKYIINPSGESFNFWIFEISMRGRLERIFFEITSKRSIVALLIPHIMYMYIYICVCIHTYIHTYIHAYIHIINI